MSNDNGSGWFGGLILGAGFAGLLLLPIVLMRKFGIGVMSVVSAAGMTVFAIAQPYLLDWANSGMGKCSMHCEMDQTLVSILTTFGPIGWWGIAIMGWIIVILLSRAHAVAQ